MTGQIFILASFVLGILVGSLVTYVIMGSYFSKAVLEISEDLKSKGDSAKEEKPSALKSIELSSNTKIIIWFVLAMVVIIIGMIFMASTDTTITSEGTEKVQESLSKPHDIDSINNALKKGVGGY